MLLSQTIYKEMLSINLTSAVMLKLLDYLLIRNVPYSIVVVSP